MIEWQGKSERQWMKRGRQISFWIPLVILCHLILPASQVTFNAAIGYRVRFVGGSNQTHSGRIEVSEEDTDQWTGICHSSLDVASSTVICRMLNFTWGEPFSTDQGPLPRNMSDVRLKCAGRENSLSSCQPVNDQNCTNSDAAAVQCHNTALRFVRQDNQNYGYIELMTDSLIRPICADGWDDIKANITCKQLGYQSGLKPSNIILPMEKTNLPRPQFLDSFSCMENETSIEACTFNVARRCASPYNPAVVLCLKSEEERRKGVKVSKTAMGLLEITYPGGLTTSICSESFKALDINITCKGLGFKRGKSFVITREVALKNQRASQPITRLKPDCIGNETQVENCPGMKAPSDIRRPYIQCTDHMADVMVACSDKEIKAKIAPFNQSMPMEGTATLNIDGKLGTICDPNWSDVDARVFCRHAGYVGGRASLISPTSPPQPSFLGDVYCSGDETNILDCPGSGWMNIVNQTVCDDPNSYARVRCYDRVQLKGLRGEAPNFGFVFVYNVFNQSKWSAVCAPEWDENEALVTCRSLGYEKGVVPSVLEYPRFTQPFPDISCRGNESDLLKCTMEVVKPHTRCPIPNLALAYCYNGHVTSGSNLSLILPNDAKPSKNTGAVKLTRGEVVSRICADDWTDANANVSCRHLGFKGGVAFNYNVGSMRYLPVVYRGMSCNGTEEKLEDCMDALDQGTSCRGSAGVLCYKKLLNMSIVDANLKPARSSGFLLLEYDGEKGHVCDSRWNERDASVACKQMGFVDGVVKLPNPLEARTFMNKTKAFLGGISCRGDESSIFMCPGTGWNITNNFQRCYGAGVSCFNKVRSDTSLYHYNPVKGIQVARVQVFDHGEWGGVCGSNFKDADAAVFCREIGYPYGRSLSPAHLRTRVYGSNYEIWIQELNCKGNESSILKCNYTNDPNAVCPMSDVNVAAAICSKTKTDNKISTSISDGQSGRVTVSRYGLTGKVCATSWNDAAATVICREHGYLGGGNTTKLKTYSQDTNLLLKYKCIGNETRISDCKIEDGINNRCTTTRDVGILCYRLSGLRASIGTKRGHTKGWAILSLDDLPGGICTSSWGTSDASVFCRSISKDYIDGITVKADEDTFGMEPTIQYLSGLDCGGREDSLLDCASPGWNQITTSRCGPGKSAAVQCYQSVRIQNQKDVGPVQVYFNARWGYVCDRGWDDKDAQVMCRQLGYRTGRSYACSLFGSKTYYYSYVWSNVNCRGDELNIDDCSHDERLYLSCPSGHYASVMCLDEEPAQPSQLPHSEVFRLTSTVYDTLGIVEFKYGGVWGRICPDTWDDKAAGILCRHLGLGKDGIAYRSASRTVNNHPFWMSGVRCNGNERSIIECEQNDFGNVCGCDITNSAGVVCYNTTGLEMRLAGTGATSKEGRVEVAIEGRWGTICDYGFGDEDASIICKYFNFTSGQAKNQAKYGRGKGPYWFTNLICRGNESSVTECGLTGWDIQKLSSTEGSWSWSCPTTHARDAGVYCFGNVRLQDTTKKDFGRIEMNLDGKWFQVCDDGSFDDTAAQIACNELGYSSGTAFCCSALGPSRNPSMYETASIINLKCTGNESSIRDCAFVPDSVCSQKRYMSVACSNKSENETEFKLRLNSEPRLGYTGQVEIEVNGVKGRICAKNWDDKDAIVVCKQLGFKGGATFSVSQRQTTPYVMGRVNCTGSESSLQDCERTKIGAGTGCAFNEYGAGVICYNGSGIVHRLAHGGKDHGQIEIGRDGVFGTICSYGWSSTESRVYCRQRGYVDGTMYRTGSKLARDKEMFISFVNCNGEEDSILECKNQGWGNVPSYCRQYYSPVFIFCFGNVRLNNWISYPSSAGAVEVYKNGEWNVVCDDEWDELDASVICRELGFAAGYAICCNAYGHHYRKAIFTKIACDGNETSLMDCPRVIAPDDNSCNYATAICRNDTTTPTDYELIIGPTGSIQYSGRLRLIYSGIRGRICSDGWDNNDAQVACREMNYPYGEAYTHYESSTSILGAEGPWWTSQLNCTGNETRLFDCPSAQWGKVRQCNSRHTAGVLCYAKSGVYFRMVNGDESSGRVEISVEGEWGTVCDLYWDDKDSRALCRQFGFVDGKSVYDSKHGKGAINSKSWLLRYSCNGTEDSLRECPHQGFNPSGYSRCTSHENDAGVQCFKRVRLDSERTKNETFGAVVYHYNNTWFSICDDNFTDTTAQVVCQSLGYPYGRALCCSAWVSTSHRLLNSSLHCTGQETDIDQCEQSMECNSQNFASVYCFKEHEVINDTSYGFRFENTSSTHGRIIVKHWSRLSRICPDGWDNSDALVFCRMKGYEHGIAYIHSALQRGQQVNPPFRKPYILNEFNCTGSEKSLLDCPHRNHTDLGECKEPQDAGALCFTNVTSGIEFRIVDGPSENQGRVEVGVDGVWGTICDQAWDGEDAKVLCRQMGYSDGMALKSAHFGPGNGTVWLSHIHCKGNESSLLDCPHEGWDAAVSSASKICREHTKDASVYCFSNVTIGIKPNSTMGVIRLYTEDKWNLVCEDSWSDTEAKVACRQIGQEDGKAIPHHAFGRIEYNITIPKIKCKGTESKLSECMIDAVDQNATCNSGSYASAYCSNETITDDGFAVKFFVDDLSTNYYGIPMVRLDGLWGRICKNNFSETEANITCRHMGFAGGMPYQHLAVNFYPVFMSNVSCIGNEASLLKCSYTKWGDQYACENHVFEAGVICYEEEQGAIQYRLAGSNDNSSGRIEIKYNETWGTVCDLGWSISDARVICSQFGYKDGLALTGSHYGSGAGPVWVQSFSCAGNESTLLTCPNSGWNSTWEVYNFYRCENHRRDASAKCFAEKMVFQDYRLVGSENPGRGRVEIFISQINEWGTVCDDSWDDKDATVVCRFFNYTSGKAVGNARYGQGSGQIWLDEIACTGNETSLEECPHQGLGRHDCYHFEDAGVICSGPLFGEMTTSASTRVSSTTRSVTQTKPIMTRPPISPIPRRTTTTKTTLTSTSSSTTLSTSPVPTTSTASTKSPTTSSTVLPTTTTIITSTTSMSTPTATSATTTTTSTTKAPTSTITTTPSKTSSQATTTPTTTTPTTTTPTTTPTTTAPTTTPPTTTKPTTSEITESSTASASSQSEPPIGIVVGPLLAIFVIAVIIIAIVLWVRHRGKSPFRRERLRSDPSDNGDSPVAYDASRPDSKSFHFTNQLYDLSEINNELSTASDKDSDGKMLVDHDYLTDETDIGVNPLYDKVKTSDA